jgi:eukaryotic-like serine/threonine-protein kinase
LTTDRLAKVEQLLHEAMQLAPSKRAAFVANINDADVRAEVSSLLAAEGEQGKSTINDVIGEAAQVALDEPFAGHVLGHFRVVRQIGRGAMGEVYLAEDVKLGRRVALKLLPMAFQQDSERVRRFEREARAAAALNHPNILTVHEVGEWEGRSFIATEFVEGETLAQRLSRGPFSVAETARVGTQIAGALAAAHQARIIHRDLKPANIMVRADGTVKVLDFGLARLSQRDPESATAAETETMLTQPGAVLGTPAYMAPEQWQGKPADARSDIYAFGCLLYEMLTGRRVGIPRLPVQSRALEDIVSRCLESDPADRWQSAADLGHPLAKVQRAGTYWREIAIAAAAVIILALGSVVWWQQRAQGKPLTDKDVMVLADFRNRTADPVFDGTLRQALAIQLEQSPFLKVMDEAQVRQNLRFMGRSPEERITNEIAHDICVREAAAATIDGSIASLGKSYVITIQAVTCQTGATLAREQAQAEDKEHVLRAVGKAATAMRAKLGESLASIQKLNRPLDQFTTPSLEALQTYAMGYTPQSQGQFLAAIPFFQRATELDPNFAMAYMGLSLAYSNAGDMVRSNEYQRKAFALIDGVSEFERLFISARYYWQATGELNKAIDFNRLLARSYPRFWGTHSWLSFIYRSMGDFEKSLEAAQEAVRLEPRVEPPYRNLVSAYTRLDRLGEAKELLAKARAQQFDGPMLHQRLLEIAYIDGDQAAVEREIQWYAGRPEEYFSFGRQAANAVALGQRRQARELYRRAADAALRRGLSGVAAEFDEADALAESLLGNCQMARRVGRPPLALALCGDAAQVEKLAGETSKIFPNGTIWNAVQLPVIRAAIELSGAQPAKAIELLASAAPYERAYPELVYLRGLAYLRLHKSAEAAAEFQKILDHKGANWGLVYSLSYPGLARAAAVSGDTPKARKAYQDFLALWKNADSDLAVLAEAHKEFAALR